MALASVIIWGIFSESSIWVPIPMAKTHCLLFYAAAAIHIQQACIISWHLATQLFPDLGEHRKHYHNLLIWGLFNVLIQWMQRIQRGRGRRITNSRPSINYTERVQGQPWLGSNWRTEESGKGQNRAVPTIGAAPAHLQVHTQKAALGESLSGILTQQATSSTPNPSSAPSSFKWCLYPHTALT